YSEASSRLNPPELIRCRTGNGHAMQPPSIVTAVADEREFQALCDGQEPCILAPTKPAADALRGRWGLNSDQRVETQIAHAPSGEPVPLLDRHPALELL